MTTSISSEAFEKKNRKLKNERLYSKQKNHKWKNGQGELLNRCFMIIKAKKGGKTFHKKSQNLMYYKFLKTVMSFIAKPSKYD